MSTPRRFLFFGAHPDDADLLFGGTAIKLARAGHAVKFVSACNGDCGHQSMSSPDLAKRRYLEAQASAKIAGLVEYEVLPIPDCRLECNLANRETFIRIIRRFQPDVVISHRSCDYHAD
ncbi:MAG TPA: PIG-L family deacetylase, partial [Lentisphaeria bacterium]|nr:PIG-L family deacetylase [Lentisphaeria bacterium]